MIENTTYQYVDRSMEKNLSQGSCIKRSDFSAIKATAKGLYQNAMLMQKKNKNRNPCKNVTCTESD